jgi:hypothetical protein
VTTKRDRHGWLGDLRHLLSVFGLQRHTTGPFAEKVCDYLAKGEPVTLPSGKRMYLVVDAVQVGDNPFAEDVAVQFHLQSDPPTPGQPPKWDALAEEGEEFTYDIPPDAKPGQLLGEADEYFFTFSGGMSVDENAAALNQYIREQFPSEGRDVRPPQRKSPRHN